MLLLLQIMCVGLLVLVTRHFCIIGSDWNGYCIAGSTLLCTSMSIDQHE
jgi:hypothetical protein